jgi:hypothetical protein
MGRETGSLHLLAPLLLTGGKGADLVIRGNVVLNSRNITRGAPIWRANASLSSVDSRGHNDKFCHKYSVGDLGALLYCLP